MYHPKTGISIPMPCGQNWHNMPADKNGRHCAACSKTVVDFTGMSDTEILLYLQQRNDAVCGRFSNHQLNRPLKKQFSIIQLFNMNKIAATIISFIMVKNSHAQLPAYDTSIYTWLRSTQTDSVILAQQKQYRETNTLILGNIRDENNKPLRGAKVTAGMPQLTTITNSEGTFSLTIPNANLQPFTNILVVAEGKKAAVRSLHYTNLPAQLLINMQPLQPCACPVTMGVIENRCCDINISMTVDQLFEKEKPLKKTNT
jgi:hypothetical protein